MPDPARPNILFIHTDSMDGRAMGCMGHSSLRGATPALDRLAEEGVLFRNAYCNNPICCPSRASMMSGLFTHRCEGWNNYKGLEPGAPTFFDRIADAGYRLKILGKTDYVSGRHTIRARVSPWLRSAGLMRPNYRMGPPSVADSDDPRVHGRDWAKVDAAVEFLRAEAGSGAPFFLHVGTGLPHPGFRTSRHYLGRIDPLRVELPPEDPSDHLVLAYQRVVKNWMHGLSDEAVRLVRRIYFAMIAEVDAMVATLLDAVDAAGLADSTYVIFSSDHGELAMEHGQFYKMSPFEPSVRVPLIVRGPGVVAGRRTDTLVSLVDVHPTLMDMAGLRRTEGLDGHSLKSELRGGVGDHPGWVLSEFHGTSCSTGVFMLRQDAWKYVVYAGEPSQLFDLAEDPWEVNDLAAARPDKVREMDGFLRGIVDYEAVDAKVKAYDRAAFRAWRDEHLAAGDYRDLMARVFSGWDALAEGEAAPWTDADERRILEWLDE